MKILILLMLQVLLFVIIFVPEKQTANKEGSAFYKEMISFHQRVDKNVTDGAVIFIGDSLVQGLAVSSIAPKAVNFGIGNDTTEGVIKRLPLYSSLGGAKTIVLSIGINDLKNRKIEAIVKSYRKILQLLPASVPVLLNAILPVDERVKKRRHLNSRIRRLNEQIKKLSEQHTNIRFLDMTALLTNEDGNLLKKYHVGDGLHLNASGNIVWIQALTHSILSKQVASL